VSKLKRASLLGLLLVACATATPPPAVPEEPTPTPAARPEPTPPPAPCAAFARPGVLRRSAMDRAVRGGLGPWLHGGVVVDPSMEKKRFRGWIIRSLYPRDACYEQVDLRPGDVVLKVNGKAIERPEQASEVFQSLSSAPALVVEFLREGAPMKLTFQIAEE
jgi:S1-C subfamily serine protease